jgi:Xaa-Pro aminopeptidase
MATRDPAALLRVLALLGLSACAVTPTSGDDLDWVRAVRVDGPVAETPEGDPAAECDARRAALAERLPGPGVVFLQASESGHDRFFQNDDFWYLTNSAVADIAMAVVIGPDGDRVDEVLWLPPHDANWEVWNGERPSPGPEAEAATGFARTAALPTDDEGWSEALSALGSGTLYSLGDELPDVPGLTRDDEGALRAALSAQRLVKSEYEIACLVNAIDITVAALHEAYSVARPGMWEFQAQSAIDGTFLRLGSERAGFPSICGSGPNTTALHYADNRRQTEDGDLLLMDVGAKYRYYCADVTRTIPVNGTFSPRQREIYDLVLAAQRAGEAAAVPGCTMVDIHRASAAVFEEAGLREHFKHFVGHWIGLDVHDVGGRVPIVENTLFTIEPGLYLADEGLGVRIEDDYLMTKDGIVKLSAGIPSDPEAIETLMASLR